MQFLSCVILRLFLPWVCTLKRQVQEVLFKKFWAARSRTFLQARRAPRVCQQQGLALALPKGPVIYSGSMTDSMAGAVARNA